MANNITVPMVAVPALIASIWGGFEAYNQVANTYATKDYVLQHIQAQQVDVAARLDRIEAGQLSIQLRQLYVLVCRGENSTEIRQIIRELEQRYRQAAGQDYKPPSCDLLTRPS